MAKVLLHFNFKGGVGKTTMTVLDTYLLSRMGKKVLLIDMDPQSNATEIINATFDNHERPKTSFYDGLMKFDLSGSIVHITEHLDMIPSDWALSAWPGKVEKRNRHDRALILRDLIEPFRDHYDYILFDVPPTLSTFTNNAILASDYITLVLQTQRQSYTSILKTAQYMSQLRADYDAKYDVIGVILYLVKNNAKTDTEISNEAKKSFSDAVFHNHIYQQERIKVFGDEGIRDKDHWDKRALKMYQATLDEELKRIGDFNNE
ncbi:AAA family ATPase (plasmid) [Nicoliella spurrieriana]|uniref:AAA family ATPase n=1 Tax=Nicoliella spurrieriana TaxID=2925830 RepID=A0A976RR02_9LACO|nr:ParA family protein [Nicoliella spurrieriana]UQS86155.1 AAA family ATPase [Nicoliella spurrieriana]